MAFNPKSFKLPLSSTQRTALRNAVTVGGKVAQTAVHLTTGTTAVGKVGAVLGLLHAVMGEPKPLASEYADHTALTIPRAVQTAVFGTLLAHGVLAPGRERGSEREWVLRFGDATIAWVVDGQSDPLGPWCSGCVETAAKAAIGCNLWDALGSNVIAKVIGWRDVSLLPDTLTDSEPSAIAVEVTERTRKLTRAGESRGILFYGPPGTGKSFIMREVAKSIGGLTIRHTCEYITDDVLPCLVELLKPRVLLMDDIDRGSTSGILSTMEVLKKHCDVVLVSVNYTDKLDPAIRRPGRFDESIFVGELDDVAFRLLVDGAPAKALDVLRKLPAAFINEYMINLNHLGEDMAAKRLIDLVKLNDDIQAADAPPLKAIELVNPPTAVTPVTVEHSKA